MPGRVTTWPPRSDGLADGRGNTRMNGGQTGLTFWFTSAGRPVKVARMKKQNFWDVDLIELFKLWFSDITTFLMTLLMFVGLSLPVVIPGLILWYLWSINWHP